MIKNERGRYLNHFELMPLLGFEHGAHLPKEGFAPIKVQGQNFDCLPANGGKHRIRFECQFCLKWIPFGRAGQHLKACIVKHNGQTAI